MLTDDIIEHCQKGCPCNHFLMTASYQILNFDGLLSLGISRSVKLILVLNSQFFIRVQKITLHIEPVLRPGHRICYS